MKALHENLDKSNPTYIESWISDRQAGMSKQAIRPDYLY